jgi:serine protease Do
MRFITKYFIGFFSALLITTNAIASEMRDFADVVEKISPAVVNISTTQKAKKKKQGLNNSMPDNPYDLFRDFLEKEFGLPDQMRKMTSLGSGFIVASDGYIVTNHHVVDGADEINVMIGNDTDKTYKAKVVGSDQKTDIALLKIDATESLPYLEFGDSDTARVGNPVIAVGNPFGLGGTVTSGIISAKARYISGETFDDYIQTDAAINSGNSGGPLCDGMTGKVLGVNSVIVSPSGGNVGIGFAIPASIVQPVVTQLKDKGVIVRGWLGVMVQPVDENIASAMGLEKPKGALVASVVKNSPADKAGIKVGDVIVGFDGKEIDSTNKLPRIVGETTIDKKVAVTVFRDNRKQTLYAVVAKPDKEDPFSNDSDIQKTSEKNSKTVLGVKVTNLNDDTRRMYGIDSSTKGVVVTDIEKTSIMAFTGVRTGDVIVSVNQKAVNSADDFERAFDDIKRKGKGSAAILVSRKGVNQFIGIELK